MPVHWREDLKQRWLVLVYSDPYTVAEWEQTITLVLQHPRWQPPRRLLVDRRYCAAPTTQFVHDIERFIRNHEHDFSGANVAVVVGTDAGYGMTRMHENLAEAQGMPLRIRAFRDWNEAETWLDERGRAS